MQRFFDLEYPGEGKRLGIKDIQGHWDKEHHENKSNKEQWAYGEDSCQQTLGKGDPDDLIDLARCLSHEEPDKGKRKDHVPDC